MSLPVLAVSTNHTMAPTDCGREINFTQGGMKLNLPAAAAAGNGAMVAVRNSAPEATAYGNALGTGNRTGSITLSGNFSWDSGTFANLVDGSYANQCDEPGVGLAGLAGAVIQFDFGAGNRKYIDEIRIARSGAGNCGSWRVQASDDGVSWSVVSADFALTAASTLVACTPAQAGHRHYRLLGVSGNWSNVWWQEVEFRIAGAGGSGEITIDPFAAETLDGQATRPLRRGGCVLLRSDGDGWSTVSGEYTYESGEQALVLAAVTTLAHGLGVTPKSLLVKLRCRIAELGYSAGDEVVVNPQGESNAYVNSTIVVSLSAASLVFVMNSHGLAIQHRTMPTPGGNTITLANWKIIFIAKDTY
jgi:hypothetical protein